MIPEIFREKFWENRSASFVKISIKHGGGSVIVRGTVLLYDLDDFS